jgi:RNA polymerase sigma-70 factor (ECF subfamily)
MTDIARFEALVVEFQDMVFAVALRLLGNADEAQDVSQTVFMRAFEHFDQVVDSPALAGWLKTVATHASLNHLARYRSRWRLFSELAPEGSDAGRGESQLESLASSAATAEEAALGAEQQRRLERALQALPDHQRVPLVLFHFEDRSYQEIAELTGVSLAKVKTDIYRGREALRKVVGGDVRSA